MGTIIAGIFIPLIISCLISFYIYKKDSDKILLQIGLFISYIVVHLSIYKKITFSPVQSTDYIPFALLVPLLFSIILSYKDFNNFSKLIIKILNYSLVIGISSVSFIKFTWQDNQKILIPALVIFLTLLFDFLNNKKQENNENFNNFLYVFLASLLGSGIAVVSSIASIGQILGAITAYIFPIALLLFIKEKNINTESFNLIFNSFYSMIMLNIYLLSPNEPSIYSMILIVLSPLMFILTDKIFSKPRKLIKIIIKGFLVLSLFATSAILIDNPFAQKEEESEGYDYEY